MSAVRVRSVDRGANALAKRIYGFGKVHIRVGILAKDGGEAKLDHEKHPGPVSVLMVAEWMEFGTSTIPSRSFIRAWFDENQAENKVQAQAALRAVARGAITKERALELLGQKFVAGIQARIAKGIPPELKEETIRRKKSSVPLIDTGQLRSSVTFEVVL